MRLNGFGTQKRIAAQLRAGCVCAAEFSTASASQADTRERFRAARTARTNRNRHEPGQRRQSCLPVKGSGGCGVPSLAASRNLSKVKRIGVIAISMISHAYRELSGVELSAKSSCSWRSTRPFCLDRGSGREFGGGFGEGRPDRSQSRHHIVGAWPLPHGTVDDLLQSRPEGCGSRNVRTRVVGRHNAAWRAQTLRLQLQKGDGRSWSAGDEKGFVLEPGCPSSLPLYFHVYVALQVDACGSLL